MPNRALTLISLLLTTALALAACSDLAATPATSPTTQPPNHPTVQPSNPTTPIPTLTPTPSNLWLDSAGVRVHPDGELYSGDILSFEIEARNGGEARLARVPIVVDWGSDRAETEIRNLPGGGSGSTDVLWAWDTGSLVGTQTVTVTLDPANDTGDPDPGNNLAVVHVNLLPGRPPGEIGAEWQTATSVCCTFHFISGSAAARDIAAIRQTADDALAYVADRLDARQTERVDIYLISRVLGQGGFASVDIAISYLDRNYAGNGLMEVLRHEGTHILDRLIADGERPVMLVEGFATYITGGHFKLEPLPERAAALLQIGGYIPLRDLANNFYPSQHETGYLEAAAFIDYLVRRDGYPTFVELYDGMRRQPGERDADMIDHELRAVYDLGLDELEAEWLAHLRTLDAGDQPRDLANTIAFYDTARRYQRALDPSAHFTNAWMPDIRRAESRGRVADYLRHPRAPENIALETMLVDGDAALRAGDYDRVEALLASVNAVLDAGVAFDDPIAAHYLEVVRAALAAGYEPQRITLDGERAEAWVTRAGDSTLLSLSAAWQNGAWSIRLSR